MNKLLFFRKHLYRIRQGKKPLFATESAIAGPVRKADFKQAVAQGESLGSIPDGMIIYLFDPVNSSPIMRGQDYQTDFRKLKSLLAHLGTAIPPLYKQYTELCDPGGAFFLDFNIDPAFNNCVDGLVIVDTLRIKQHKRKRYIENTILA